MTTQRVLNVLRNPRKAPGAVLRRIVPNSPRYGMPWVQLPDGSVTFRERGFVAADTPSKLLARHNYELDRIHRELGDRHFGRSIEIGCGFGRLSPAIARHSDEHIAVDINPAAIATARVTYPSIDFRSGGTQSLGGLADRGFDLAVTWTVLQHVRPEAIRQACREIVQVLSPAATVLICEETRLAGTSGDHTWHRTVSDYEELLSPLRLVRHGLIDEIAAIPGMESPGEVMLFRS